MNKKNRIIIVFLVAVLLFTSVMTGLALIVSQKGTDDEQQANNQDQVTQQEECVGSEEAKANKGDAVGPWPYKTEPTTELKSEDLRVGDGQEVKLDDCIVVHYRLALPDGTPIEGNDTFAEGVPIEFELSEGQLIAGWTQGIPGMKVGGVRRLTVPPELGYGEAERPGIPANSTLVFEVEVVEIN